MPSGRERVEAALAGSVADRPPISAWGHTFREEWSAERLARSTAERARALRWDFVKLQNRATAFAEALGGQFEPNPSGVEQPILVRAAVTEPGDWEKVIERAEAPELADALQEQVNAVRLTVEMVGPEIPVLQTIFSPVSVCGYLVGRDPAQVRRLLEEQPDRVARVQAAIAGMLERFAAASIQGGAAGIYYAATPPYASGDFISEEAYRRQILPYDAQILRSIPSAGWFNALHLCSGNVLFGLARELPVQAISWSTHDAGNPTLAEGRTSSGKAVMAGLHRRSPVATGTAAEVRAEVEAALESTSPEGLLLTPGCSVSPWPYEKHANLLAIYEAVEATARPS